MGTDCAVMHIIISISNVISRPTKRSSMLSFNPVPCSESAAALDLFFCVLLAHFIPNVLISKRLEPFAAPLGQQFSIFQKRTPSRHGTRVKHHTSQTLVPCPNRIAPPNIFRQPPNIRFSPQILAILRTECMAGRISSKCSHILRRNQAQPPMHNSARRIKIGTIHPAARSKLKLF